MGKKNQKGHQQKASNDRHSHGKPKIAKEQAGRKGKSSATQDLKPKVTNLFKIIPENDDFAALGYEDPEEEISNEEEVEFGAEEQEPQIQQQLEDDEEEDGQFEDDGQGQELQDEFEGEEEDEDEDIEEQEGEQMEGDEDEEEGEGQAEEEYDDAEFEGQGPEGEEEEEEEGKAPVDASVLSIKIQQTISVLLNIEKLGDGKPRKYYTHQLKQLFHQYYGYNYELIDHFLAFMNPSELVQLFEANEKQRPLTIRTNTLKTRRKELAQSLIQRGVNLDPLAEWSKVGIKIYESKVPIGATPEYLAGHYMLQSASSLLPVMALDPQPGEKVLDMAAAPGGKTTYIAQLMKNTGCIFANDLKKQRLKALQFNLYRLGITNTTVTCRDGRKYSKIFPNSFDRVLLDAPCTGLGIISKDYSIKANRLLIDMYKNSHVQKELLLSAIDSTRVGGVIVYSTCSVSPLENQEVVNFATKKRFVKIADIENDVGEEGLTKFVEKRFHPDLRKTRRIYPHVHNMDGFYVAKLVKVAKGKRETEVKGEEEEGNQEE